MRITFIILLFSILAVTHSANAMLDIDISEPNLEITTGFTGDTLTIFGTATPDSDVIIVVKGPLKTTTIRRKVDVAGLWLNGESVTFKNVPGYYNVASSKPIFDITNTSIRDDNKIGLNSLTFSSVNDEPLGKAGRYQEALIQNKQLQGLYALTPNAVEFINSTLFKTRIYMPANVPIGQYSIEAYLFQDGDIIDREVRPFRISQGGLAGNVHDFAYNNPIGYGMTIIIIALFSSFMAITLLRRD